jgi:ligand-binding sensor domain-containing protein
VDYSSLFFLPNVGISLTLRNESGRAPTASIPEVKPTLSGWISWAASNTYSSLVLHDDEIYTGGPGGITVWNKRTGEYRQITTQNGLPSARVMDIVFDDNYHMWVATEEGIARWDGDQWTWYDMADGLDNEYITTLWYKDWILYAGSNYAGDGGGLMRFDIHSGEDGGPWEKIKGFPSSVTPDSQTVSYQVKKILVDHDDKFGQPLIWTGTLRWYQLAGV